MGIVTGLSTLSATAAARNGRLCASATTVHRRPVRAQPPFIDPGAPPDAGQLRQRRGFESQRRFGHAYPPAIGRRRITSGASTGSSRTCAACPSPSETTAK